MDSYIIVRSIQSIELVKEVNLKMIKGYIPTGGIFVNGGCYMQAMVLRDD